LAEGCGRDAAVVQRGARAFDPLRRDAPSASLATLRRLLRRGGDSRRSLDRLHIAQVLRTAGCALVHDQIISTYEWHRDPFDVDDDPSRPRRLELDARDRLQEVDPCRWSTEPRDFVVREATRGGDDLGRNTEARERGAKSFDVLSVAGDPQIEILRRPRSRVERRRVPPYHQKAHVCGERREGLGKSGGSFSLGCPRAHAVNASSMDAMKRIAGRASCQNCASSSSCDRATPPTHFRSSPTLEF